MSFSPISEDVSAANCPLCGAYSSFTWGRLNFLSRGSQSYTKYKAGSCNHCNDLTIWEEQYDENGNVGSFKMVIPTSGSVPLPNSDLPEDITFDYNEASQIVELSPRGAVALLRLALQKLCIHLGEPGKNINEDIGSLVRKGLNPSIQQALDSVRVTGNNAVHPGSIDLTDDRETALKIFGFINIIANTMITQPKEISEFYNLKVPENLKAAIHKRDSK